MAHYNIVLLTYLLRFCVGLSPLQHVIDQLLEKLSCKSFEIILGFNIYIFMSFETFKILSYYRYSILCIYLSVVQYVQYCHLQLRG